jgi:hypothetical protein
MQNLVLDNNALTALKLEHLEQALNDLRLKVRPVFDSILI